MKRDFERATPATISHGSTGMREGQASLLWRSGHLTSRTCDASKTADHKPNLIAKTRHAENAVAAVSRMIAARSIQQQHDADECGRSRLAVDLGVFALLRT